MSRKDMERIKKEYLEEEGAILLKQAADGLLKRDLSFEDYRKHLYPEFKFESPYGMWLYDWRMKPEESIRVVDLFPFYRKIIIEIPPNPENKFRGGLSVPQIIELYKNGFIFPIFTAPPKFYTSDIFKPLFKMKDQYHIPCNRTYASLAYFGRKEFNKQLGKIKNKVLEKYGQHNQINNQIKESLSFFLERGEKSNYGDMYEEFLHNTCELKTFGGGGLVKSIFARVDDVGVAYIIITLFRDLIYPHICGIGGYMNYNQRVISFYRRIAQLYEQFYEMNDQTIQKYIPYEKNIILPQDFLVELKKRILYNAPQRVDDPLQFAYNLREYDCVEEHFRILEKIDDDLNKGNFKDVLGGTKNIREQVMPELNARIREIQKGYKQIKYGVTIGGTILASLPALPSLQVLTQGGIASNFLWVGSIVLHVLRGKYNEKLNRFFTGLRFRRNILPYLIWEHEKEHEERGN